MNKPARLGAPKAGDEQQQDRVNLEATKDHCNGHNEFRRVAEFGKVACRPCLSAKTGANITDHRRSDRNERKKIHISCQSQQKDHQDERQEEKENKAEHRANNIIAYGLIVIARNENSTRLG